MGTWHYNDLLTQTAPRLFSTHLFGKMLPSGLLAPTGSGKLVVVLRNVKDVKQAVLGALVRQYGEPMVRGGVALMRNGCASHSCSQCALIRCIPKASKKARRSVG